MRITTRAVFQMTDDPEEFIELERESYDYDGPVSEAKGGGGTTTTVQEADPWDPIQKYITGFNDPNTGQTIPGVAPRLFSAGMDVPEYYPGQTYADLTPQQKQSLWGQMNYANTLQPLINEQRQALWQGLNAAGSPALTMSRQNAGQYSNPWRDPAFRNAQAIQQQANRMVADPHADPTLQNWVSAASRPITENYQNVVGNTIAGQAAGAGGLGGSRQGIAEAETSGNYMDALGDLSANVYNRAFDRALGQQMQAGGLLGQTWGASTGRDLAAAGQYADDYRGALGSQMAALGLAPTTMQAGLMPHQIRGDVGAQFQRQNQLGIDEAVNRYNFAQNAPYTRYREMYGDFMGTPYGSSTSTAPNPNQQNALAGGLGGALGGAGLATSIWGPSALAAGSFAAPFAWPMVAGAGLLGAFG